MGVFDDTRGWAERLLRDSLRSALPTWHKIQNAGTDGAADWAVSLSTASQLPGRLDGPADAFRHLLIAAELHRVYGGNYADNMLDGHELDQGLFSDKSMDEYNNLIGREIGRFVRSNNGSTADVIKFAKLVMLNSFPGGSSANVSWMQGPETGWQVKGAKTTQLPNGVVLQPVVVAEIDPGKWLSSNPRDNRSKKRLPTNSVNWPKPGWEHKFDYTGAWKAPEYLQRNRPIIRVPEFSQETDIDESFLPNVRDERVGPTDKTNSNGGNSASDRGGRLYIGPDGNPVSQDVVPGEGDLFTPKPDGQGDSVEPGADHGNLQDMVPGSQTARTASFAGADELDIHQMAEEVFSSLTLDDWAIIPDDDDPFDGRDPFADGVKWVPGLGPPPSNL